MWQTIRRILSKASPSEMGAIAKRLSEITGRQVIASRASISEAVLAIKSPETRRMMLTVIAGSVVTAGVTGAVINDMSDGVLLDDRGFTVPEAPSNQDSSGETGGVSAATRDAYAGMTGDNMRRVTGDGSGETVWGQDPTQFATSIQQQIIANEMINKTLRLTGMSLEALRSLRSLMFRIEDEHLEAYRLIKTGR